jgi:hypothetical protein
MRDQNISKFIALQNKYDQDIEMNFGRRSFETYTSISQAVIAKSFSRNMKSFKVGMQSFTKTLKVRVVPGLDLRGLPDINIGVNLEGHHIIG